ncbi:MAG: YceI family protein [Pseudomonadota bacterium]
MKLIDFTIAFAILVVAFSVKSAITHYHLDSEHSSVSFATIKLSYVVEPAYIDSLTGQIDKNGNLNIDIPIEDIETGVSIRNERLNKLYFLSDLFPNATVKAKLPTDLFNAETQITQRTIPVIVGILGNEAEISFKVNVVKHSDTITVSTVSPTVVEAASFGVPPENMEALAKTVGGISISDKVPVSFSLIFQAA